MNNKEIVESRLANITQEQQKLRGMQDQAVAARDQALAQLAQYRDLELRLNGAATVLQEVLGAISIQEDNQALQDQAAKDQAALVAIQDKVVEIIRGIKRSKEPIVVASRLDLDSSGTLELALKLEEAFGIDVDAVINDADGIDFNKQFGALALELTGAQTINDVVDFVRRNTVSKK